MEKQQALEYIKKLASEKIISREELEHAYEQGLGVSSEGTKKFKIANLLFYIGGGIIILAISILIAQNWDSFNDATKVISTFGIGIMVYFLALFFSRDSKLNVLSAALYFISAAVIPIGLGVIFYLAGFDFESSSTHVIISALLFVFYLSSFLVLKKDIFIFFSTIFGTWLFFSLTNMIGEDLFAISESFIKYRILFVFLTYLLLGYNFDKQNKTGLREFFYIVGIFGFLGSAMVLGGWQPSQNIFWESIFPFLVFGTLILSIYLKSRAFLVAGSLFLVGYIGKITAEYFSESLGWPLALLIAGVLLIGLSYGFFYLKKTINK